VEIRAARRADLRALARLGARLAREHHAMDRDRFFLPEEPIEDGYAWWLGKELANPRAVVLAALLTNDGERRGSRMRLPRPPRGPARTSAASPRVWVSSERGSGGRGIIASPGKIVGYAYGRMEPRDWNTLRDRCGVGVDLWVEPEARGAGIGARLVTALADALVRKGAERVVIDVAARNPKAARLFERMGFRPTLLELTREAARDKAPRPFARRRRASRGRRPSRRSGGRAYDRGR
jgi:ribosomal protein S18 acetylase RimI-like enzyme